MESVKIILKPFVILGLIILAIFFLFKFVSPEKVDPQKSASVSVDYIEQIKATNDSDEKVKLYKKLIETVGAAEAQDALYKSGLPFDGQTHLLNHTVGDYLYDKFGTAGLSQCKDYFLSSCYHGFILHVIADGGMPMVAKTFAECLKEGPTVYTQCAHGIGHGFLANAGYKNLTEALKTCDEAGRTMPNFPTYNCWDGVFMENIWAVHDGTPSPDRWVKPNDPIYPCNDPRIDYKYIGACWSNQPSLDYQLFKGDIKKVGAVCDGIKDQSHKQICFDGLARQIHPLTGGSVERTLSLCSLMPDSKWKNSCITSNAIASYSVGDRTTPFKICEAVDASAKPECYGRLFSIIKTYAKSGEKINLMCSSISNLEWRKNCEANLILN